MEADQSQPSTSTGDAVDWILRNKLRVIGYTWLTGIASTLAYQWSKPGAVSVKIIHSRVYAQAITLGALGSVAALELWKQANSEPAASDDNK